MLLAGLYAPAKALQTIYARLLVAFEQFNELIGVEEKFTLAKKK